MGCCRLVCNCEIARLVFGVVAFAFWLLGGY